MPNDNGDSGSEFGEEIIASDASNDSEEAPELTREDVEAAMDVDGDTVGELDDSLFTGLSMAVFEELNQTNPFAQFLEAQEEMLRPLAELSTMPPIEIATGSMFADLPEQVLDPKIAALADAATPVPILPPSVFADLDPVPDLSFIALSDMAEPTLPDLTPPAVDTRSPAPSPSAPTSPDVGDTSTPDIGHVDRPSRLYSNDVVEALCEGWSSLSMRQRDVVAQLTVYFLCLGLDVPQAHITAYVIYVRLFVPRP